MNLKKYILGIVALGLLHTSAVSAQAVAVKKVDVMELLDVQGKVLVERLDGSQYPAQKGAILVHGSKMMMLNGSQVRAKYLQNKCEVVYSQNQVVNVRQDKQCSAGVAVINADQYAKFGNAGNPGCCVVKTITLPTVVTPSAAAAAGSSLLSGVNTNVLLAGLGILGVGIALANDDDNDVDTPVSPQN